MCPAVSVLSRRLSDGDGGGGSAAITAITKAVAAYTKEDGSFEEQQDQVKEEQEREETNSDSGSFPPGRQPVAPIPASTVKPPTTFATSSGTETRPIAVRSVLYFFRLLRFPLGLLSISSSLLLTSSHIAVPTIPGA